MLSDFITRYFNVKLNLIDTYIMANFGSESLISSLPPTKAKTFIISE